MVLEDVEWCWMMLVSAGCWIVLDDVRWCWKMSVSVGW